MKMFRLIGVLGMGFGISGAGLLAQDTEPKAAGSAEVKEKVTVDGVAETVIGHLKKLPVIIGEVKDDASADVAVGKMEELSAALLELSSQLSELDVPDDAKRKELSKKFEAQLKDTNTQMMGAMGSLRDKPESMKKVMLAMQDFGAKLSKAGKVFEKYFEPSEEKEGE